MYVPFDQRIELKTYKTTLTSCNRLTKANGCHLQPFSRHSCNPLEFVQYHRFLPLLSLSGTGSCLRNWLKLIGKPLSSRSFLLRDPNSFGIPYRYICCLPIYCAIVSNAVICLRAVLCTNTNTHWLIKIHSSSVLKYRIGLRVAAILSNARYNRENASAIAILSRLRFELKHEAIFAIIPDESG